MKDEDFINLLSCPLCKQKLVYEEEGGSLKCPQCNCKFPIIEGIVDAFVPIEGLKSSSIELAKQYERWGEFVTRGESDKRRRDIIVDLVEGNLLLEIGCAEGFMTRELTEKASQIIASDIALSYLKRAKVKVPDASFARLDIHNIPFGDNIFDTVVCAEVLEHALSPFRALEEMHRVLKPSGFLIISVPNDMTPARILSHILGRKDSLVGFVGAHMNFYDSGSLSQILEVAGFALKVITTDFVPLPLVGRFVKRLLGRYFPYLGSVTIVKATKKRIDYWEKLDQILDLRYEG